MLGEVGGRAVDVDVELGEWIASVMEYAEMIVPKVRKNMTRRKGMRPFS
jgi:hypothetical protein